MTVSAFGNHEVEYLSGVSNAFTAPFAYYIIFPILVLLPLTTQERYDTGPLSRQ
jgi:hypothetical protein